MTKAELIDKYNEIFSKFEDLEGSIEEIRQEAKKLNRLMQDLPTEVSDIEEDEKEE